MTPWAYALPAAITLFTGMVALYILFSPIGVVGGLSTAFWPLITAISIVTAILCTLSVKRWRRKYDEELHWGETQDKSFNKHDNESFFGPEFAAWIKRGIL